MSTVLDTTRTQAFAEQALGIVNGGFLSLMLSVGHRTGLLDTLATLEPATSDRIAAAAGLNERYVRDRLEAGIDVLDMGCGEGVAIRMMAHRFPRSRFVGVDMASEAIETARAEAEAANLTNARFLAQDAATFSTPRAFDFITAFDAIH